MQKSRAKTDADFFWLMNRPGRYPPQIKYIIGNEACERFTYYGLMGILELYLVNRMAMADARATQTLHLFGTAVYFLPLAGGWLADRWLGRYRTILSISLVYCLGSAILAVFEGSPTALFLGLALIAIGAGGIKPCVSAFVGDQFGPDQQHLLPRVYGWFYWAINLGSAGGFFIIPWVHARASYRWAFALPGAVMALAIALFWLGTRPMCAGPRHPPATGCTSSRSSCTPSPAASSASPARGSSTPPSGGSLPRTSRAPALSWASSEYSRPFRCSGPYSTRSTPPGSSRARA